MNYNFPPVMLFDQIKEKKNLCIQTTSIAVSISLALFMHFFLCLSCCWAEVVQLHVTHIYVTYFYILHIRFIIFISNIKKYINTFNKRTINFVQIWVIRLIRPTNRKTHTRVIRLNQGGHIDRGMFHEFKLMERVIYDSFMEIWGGLKGTLDWKTSLERCPRGVF